MKNINKKNYFKLFLLSLLTPLLCIGVSFGASAVPGSLVSHTEIDINACGTLPYNSTLGDFFSSNQISNINFGCFYVYGPSNALRGAQGSINGPFFNGNLNMNFSAGAPLILCGGSDYLNAYLQLQLMLDCYALDGGYYLSFDLYDVSQSSCPPCEDCSNISSALSKCESTVSKLESDYNSLSGNYATCQSSLASCQNSGSNCDTLYGVCVENLSGCNSDKVSLQNNIDSLTLQLQNCLGQSCNGSGDYGTGAIFNQYSLYRTDDEIDYSTPITNNLFLPLGYKGKINEDNILSIAKINTLETAYQFSESDKPVVINSMGFVMLFFLGTGLLIVVIMYLRRFISKK